jgi:CheY-like chemotaxis protein
VDDAPEMAVIVRALARRAGCDVAACPDAESAWAALQGTRPDLVLLDVNLPGADGLELCRRVRAAPGLAGLCVALYCHAGLDGDVAAGLDAGVDFVFAKDLAAQPDAWGRRLAEILGWSHGRPSMPPLGWTVEVERPPAEWVPALNRALRRPPLRGVGPEATRALLRRALEQALAPPVSAAALAAWRTPDGLALDPARSPPALPPGSAARVAAAVAEQFGRLLGADAAAAFRAAP